MSERGSASVLAVLLAAAIALLGVVVGSWVSVVDLRHRAGAAADLAALAGAQAGLQGLDACAAADRVAAANGGALQHCVADAATVRVAVVLPGRVRVLGVGLPISATGRARAGASLTAARATP